MKKPKLKIFLTALLNFLIFTPIVNITYILFHVFITGFPYNSITRTIDDIAIFGIILLALQLVNRISIKILKEDEFVRSHDLTLGIMLIINNIYMLISNIVYDIPDYYRFIALAVWGGILIFTNRKKNGK